jgi:hypothetical protein
VWEIEINGYKEKGYLDLRHDRTYGTNYVSSNPAETLKFKHEYNEISYWREKNKKVCIASSWEAGNFIYNTTVKEEICLWDIVEGPAGRISLRFTAGFIQNGVFANKIGD